MRSARAPASLATVPGTRGERVAFAALAVAIAALLAALTGGAIGLPGRDSVDRNDIDARAVQAGDLSKGALRRVASPRAYALVTGPTNVEERFSRGVSDANLGANNGLFCIEGLAFRPRHVQVTLQAEPTNSEPPRAFIGDNAACDGVRTVGVEFGGDLTYSADFFVAIFR